MGFSRRAERTAQSAGRPTGGDRAVFLFVVFGRSGGAGDPFATGESWRVAAVIHAVRRFDEMTEARPCLAISVGGLLRAHHPSLRPLLWQIKPPVRVTAGIRG